MATATLLDTPPDPSLDPEDVYVPDDWDLIPYTGAVTDVGDLLIPRPGALSMLSMNLTDKVRQVHKVVDHSPCHLKPENRKKARARTAEALYVGLRHAAALHYSEGSDRWMGIENKDLAKEDHFPTEADCSSFASWSLWNSIAHEFHKSDVVNGLHWEAGNTATMVKHGLHIPLNKPAKWMRCDAILYGNPISHTALLVGWDKKLKYHMVISNGSEQGPLYLKWNYRDDAVAVRRYI